MSLSAYAILTLAELRRHLKVGQSSIASAPAPSTTGATFTPSAGGFLAGMPITIVSGGVDHLVTIADVVGNAVTWTPALSQAPSAGDVVYDGAGDAILEDIINAVSFDFERITGRYVIQRESIIEARHGDGRSQLALRRRPVNSISSITIDGSTLGYNDYVFDVDSGIITLKTRSFCQGVGNVEIIYDAGYLQENVPPNLSFAVRQWCKFVYDEWHNDAIAATSVSIGNQTFMIKPDLPTGMKKTIDSFVDHRVW